MGQIVTKRDNGVIYSVYQPVMDETLCEVYVKEMIDLLRNPEEKQRIIIDTTEMSQFPSHLRRKIAAEINQYKHNIYKTAMIGVNNPLKKAMVQVTLLLVGREDIKVFDTEKTALEWLFT